MGWVYRMKALYREERMGAERRIRTATRLQVPDRVPVSPLIYYFAAHYAGMTNYELYDPLKYNRAIDMCFYDLGPWTPTTSCTCTTAS